jgi:hypothetical protein
MALELDIENFMITHERTKSGRIDLPESFIALEFWRVYYMGARVRNDCEKRATIVRTDNAILTYYNSMRGRNIIMTQMFSIGRF